MSDTTRPEVAEASEIGNVVSPEKFHGRDGAREFWGAKYRDTFRGVKSTFRNVFRQGGRVALEWTTEATTSDCKPVQYDGVSILESDGHSSRAFAPISTWAVSGGS